MLAKIDKAKKIKISDAIVSFVATNEPERLSIDYYFIPETKQVIASVVFGNLAQGPPGYAHGGAIAAVLDEAMGITSWLNDLKVLTTELTVKYIKAVKLNLPVFIETKITLLNKDELVIEAKLVNEDETNIFATGKAKFAVLDDKKWLSIGIDTRGFISDDYIEK